MLITKTDLCTSTILEVRFCDSLDVMKKTWTKLSSDERLLPRETDDTLKMNIVWFLSSILLFPKVVCLIFVSFRKQSNKHRITVIWNHISLQLVISTIAPCVRGFSNPQRYCKSSFSTHLFAYRTVYNFR